MSEAAERRHDLEAQRKQLPGCGFALYAVILFVFFVLGVLGISMSTLTILDASKHTSPFNLTYGGNVEPVLLLPMTRAGLLVEGEVPDAFHAETITGDSACAIKGGDFLRISPEGPLRMPLSSITAVEETKEGVRVVGASTVFCAFMEGEGGDRFARMLRP